MNSTHANFLFDKNFIIRLLETGSFFIQFAHRATPVPGSRWIFLNEYQRVVKNGAIRYHPVRRRCKKNGHRKLKQFPECLYNLVVIPFLGSHEFCDDPKISVDHKSFWVLKSAVQLGDFRVWIYQRNQVG